MNKIRISFITLTILSAVVFNLERFDIAGESDVINLDSFVYLLFVAILLITITLPVLWRVPRALQIVAWMSIYVVLKLTVGDRPFITGNYLYLTITEMTLLTLGVFLAYRITVDLQSLENVVANITLTDVSSRVLEFDKASDEVAKEFIRSRRYNIPLSVLVIKLDPAAIRANRDNTMEEVLTALMTRYTANTLVRVLDKQLRRTDLIIEQPRHHRLILLFPETDGPGSKEMAARIEKMAEKSLGVPVSCGHATFPDEAVTFEELLQRAEEHYNHQSVHLADLVGDRVENLSARED